MIPVRLATSTRDQHVTRLCRSVSFTRSALGGDTSARVRLDLPRRDWPDLGANDSLYLYDPRTGEPLWDGYTQNPGTTDDDSGQGFDLGAYGGAILANDDRRALVYIDREQTAWQRSPNTDVQPQSARTEWAPRPGVTETPGLLLGFSSGQPIDTGYMAEMAYFGFVDAGMEIGAVAADDYAGGTTDSGYDVRMAWSLPFDWSQLATLSTTGASFSHFAGDGTLPTGFDGLSLEFVRTGAATNVADDDHWAHFEGLRVLGRRMEVDGSLVTGAINDTHVLASWVVADVFGRMLRLVCDPTSAVIDVTTELIDQLVYRQPVTCKTVLDDMVETEPDFRWGIGPRNPAGLHSFEWRAWTSEPRYEITTRDGYSAPGGDQDQCNRIVVRWTENGLPRSKPYSQTVTDLGSRVRHADPIDLPEGRGSEGNADIIGPAVLAATASPSKSATATVARPIVDRLTGRMVNPREIQPGWPVAVRDTGDVLRLTEVTVNVDDSGERAQLTLGTPFLTQAQRIARLAKVR